MTDKELIRAFRVCSKHSGCAGCPIAHDFDDCIAIGEFLPHALIERLEALLAENEHFRDLTKMLQHTREKGATDFDKLCHKVFDANAKNYRARDCGVRCGCGHKLEVYYCESQLYLVECFDCETKALVKARSPKEAAYKTFAHEVIPVDDMGEDCAVFFSHTPIDEPPVYVGSTIDCDFPDDVVCGMYLPCPGTDGNDFKKGDCDVHPDQ